MGFVWFLICCRRVFGGISLVAFSKIFLFLFECFKPGSLCRAEAQLSGTHWFFFLVLCVQAEHMGSQLCCGPVCGVQHRRVPCLSSAGSGGTPQAWGLQWVPKMLFLSSTAHFLPLVFCSVSGMFWKPLESCLASRRRAALAVWGHTNNCCVSGAITNWLIWECT